MLIDCFLFAGEWEMLDLRARTLAGVVDQFVPIVCTRTHQNEDWNWGWVVECLMRDGRMSPFVIEPSMQLTRRNGDVWTRPDDARGEALTPWFQHIEKQHRNAARSAVRTHGWHVVPDNVVMVSDVDEIPDPRYLVDRSSLLALLDVMPGNAVCCAQRFHSGALDLLHPQQPWWGSIICRAADVEPQQQRDDRTTIGSDDQQIGVLGDSLRGAGWHFSWFGTDAERARKLDTFSHAELRGQFDPAEGRRTRTHSNGEQLEWVSVGENNRLDWPAPLFDGTFKVPDHWWAS